LKAMAVSNEEASALVRFSLGRDSTLAEVDTVESVLPAVIRQARGY